MSPRPDIAWSRQLAGISVSAVMLWIFAGTVVLAAHGVAGWWVMRERQEPMASAPEPAAIMIDLAAVPMAPAAVEDQIAPDEVDSEAAEAVEAEPVEEIEEIPPETVEAIEPEPVEEIEPIEEMVAALDPVEVPLPQVRPEPPKEEVKEKPKEKPRRKPEPVKAKPKPSAPATEQRRAQVQTQREAPRAAAQQNSSGASSSVSPAPRERPARPPSRDRCARCGSRGPRPSPTSCGRSSRRVPVPPRNASTSRPNATGSTPSARSRRSP